MSFLAPLGLLALLALPIIVLLHLMRERRRRVQVPSLLLWQQLPKRPEAERRQRLPLTLLLLLHLLAALTLALALAQPQWLQGLIAPPRHLVLVIDTSTSMAAVDAAGQSRLDRARERARAEIAALGVEDTVTVIAAGNTPRLLAGDDPEGTFSLQQALDQLEAAGVGTDIVAAINLAQATLEPYPQGRVLVLSDAAMPTLAADLEGLVRTRAIEWINPAAATSNQAIVALSSRTWGGSGAQASVQIFARIANYDAAAVTRGLQLYAGDELLDEQQVTISGESDIDLSWTLPSGYANLRLALANADALPADDRAVLSLADTQNLNVLLVSAEPGALERALRAVPGLNLAILGSADYESSPLADQANLVIFDGTLPEAWPSGAVLLINPPESTGRPGDAPLIFGPLETDITGAPLELQPDAVVLDGLSLESVRFGAIRRVDVPEWATVLATLGEAPLIVRGRLAERNVAIWTFNPAAGNLSARLVFPLLVARTVRDLVPAPLPPAMLVGERLVYRPAAGVERIEMFAPDNTVQTINPPGSAAPLELSFNRPGIHTLVEYAGGQEIARNELAINAGSPLESDLRPQAVPAGLADVPPAARALTAERGTQGQPLWFWLAALALIVMMVEWLYVHRPRRSASRV